MLRGKYDVRVTPAGKQSAALLMAVMNLQRLRLRCSNVSSNCRESQARRWSMSGRITLRRAGVKFWGLGAALLTATVSSAAATGSERDRLREITQNQCVPNWLREKDPAPCINVTIQGAPSDGSGPGSGQSIRTAGRAPSRRQGLHGRVYIGRRWDGVQRRAWVCVVGRQINARRRVTAGFELRLGAMTRESPEHRHWRAHLDALRRWPALTIVRHCMGPRKSRLPRSTPFFRNIAYAVVT
jgi:hypothetical protein